MLVAIQDFKGIVTGWQEIVGDNIQGYTGTIIEVSIDLSDVDIVGNYKLVGTTLVELTEEEKQQVDVCPQLTTEERVLKLEEEKAILAENVYQLASILEIMLGGIENGQTTATTTDTAN